MTQSSLPSRSPRSNRRNGKETRPDEAAERLRGLRGRFSRDERDRLVIATLQIRLAQDHWLGRFSAAHPEVQIRALHWAAIDDATSVLDYWIAGLPGGTWTREIARNRDVSKVEALAETGEGGLYRVVQRMNPVVHLYRRLRLPLRFPMAVGAGVIAWEVMCKKSELDAILEFFRERKLTVAVSSVRRGLFGNQPPILTPRQRELLSEAIRSGYFAVPRRITLTDLAKRLGRSKSSISESLAHIERRILEGTMLRATSDS